MLNTKIRTAIAKFGEDRGVEVELFTNDSFDNSIIAVTDDGIAIYDFEKMVGEWIEDYKDTLDPEEDATDTALDTLSYNTLRSLDYNTNPKKPIVINFENTMEGILAQYEE